MSIKRSHSENQFELKEFESNISDLPKEHLQTHISCIPRDIIIKIFSELGVRDLISCSQVCKYWYSLSTENSLWKRHIENSFSQFFKHIHQPSFKQGYISLYHRLRNTLAEQPHYLQNITHFLEYGPIKVHRKGKDYLIFVSRKVFQGTGLNIWDLKEQKTIAVLPNKKDYTYVDLRNGTVTKQGLICTIGRSNDIYIWDVAKLETGTDPCIATFIHETKESFIHKLDKVYELDGDKILSLDSNGEGKIWNLQSQLEEGSIKIPPFSYFSHFKDLGSLWIFYNHHSLIAIDVSTRQNLCHLKFSEHFLDLFIKDNHFLILSFFSGTIKIWDLRKICPPPSAFVPTFEYTAPLGTKILTTFFSSQQILIAHLYNTQVNKTVLRIWDFSSETIHYLFTTEGLSLDNMLMEEMQNTLFFFQPSLGEIFIFDLDKYRGSCKTPAFQKIDDFDANSQSQQAGSYRADEIIPERVGEEARGELAPKGRFSGRREFCNYLYRKNECPFFFSHLRTGSSFSNPILFLKESQKILLSAKNGTILMLNVKKAMQNQKKPIAKLSSHKKKLISMILIDEHFLLSTSYDKTLKIWDLQKRNCLSTFSFLNPSSTLSLSHNFKIFFTHGDRYHDYNLSFFDFSSF